jgi:hypothetical protein
LNLNATARAIGDFRQSVMLWEALGQKDLPPYMVRQQGEAYWRLATALQTTKDTAGARATAKKLITLAAKQPTLFAIAPALDWINEAKKISES